MANGMTQKEHNQMMADNFKDVTRKIDELTGFLHEYINQNEKEHMGIKEQIWKLRNSWIMAIVLSIPATALMVFAAMKVL